MAAIRKTGRLIIAGICLSMAAGCAHAQERGREVPGKSGSLSELVDLAFGAPPEAAVDVLLRVMESSVDKDAARRLELLESLWSLAYSLRESSPTIGYSPSGDDGISFRDAERIQNLRLDKLSVQCRIISELLKIDPARARKRFGEVDIQGGMVDQCKVLRVPLRAEYFEMAARISESTFSVAERKDGKHVKLLQEVLDHIATSADLAAAARLAGSVRVSPGERKYLVEILLQRMNALRGDLREFYIGARRLRLMDAMLSVLQVSSSDPVLASSFASALAQYLEAHLKEKPCDDIVLVEDAYEKFRNNTALLEELKKDDNLQINIRPDIAEDFNKRFRGTLAGIGIAMDPLVVAVDRSKWSTDPATLQRPNDPVPDIEVRIRGLFANAKSERESPASERPGQERQAILDLLGDLERERRGEKTPEITHYLTNSDRYLSLLEFPKDASLAELITKSYIKFLSNPALRQQYPQYWVYMLRGLAKRGRVLSAEARTVATKAIGAGGSFPGINAEVQRVVGRCMEEAIEPTVALYGRLERELPTLREINQ